MPEVLEVTRSLQLGVEVTAGTTVAATKRMQTLGYMPDMKLVAEPFVPAGQFLETVMVLSKEWTEGTLTGKPSYGELVYPLSALLGPATITTPGGGIVSRQFKWNIYGNVALVPQTFSSENGDSTEAELAAFWHLVALNMVINRQSIALTGKSMAQKTNIAGAMTTLTAVNAVQTITLTSPVGTWTISFRGQTLAGIASNATGATIQTGLAALPTIGAGNVSVTGGAGGPYVVTFQGTLGNQPVSALTLGQPSTSGSAAVVQTTTGVTITPEPTATPLVPNQVNVYVDTSSGSLGSTQFLRDFDATIDFQDLQDQVWPLNSSLGSFGAIAPKVPKPFIKLTVAQDSQGLGLITAIRNGTRQFIRISSTGPIIEGAIAYSVTMDFAVNVQSVGTPKSVNGIHAREMTCQIAHDAAWGQAAAITVVSNVQAL